MHSPQHTSELARINAKILAEGQELPAVTLKDGSTVQTGTVAALLRNVALFNSGERGQVEVELDLAVPTLFKVGMFELFPPEEWICGSNPGRAFVGRLAKRFLESHGAALPPEE
jgi:hypothetical protein